MKYFQSQEFDCRCRRGLACSAVPMKESFLSKLVALRELWGRPLSPTSARRCKYWNDKNGGAAHSMHLVGNASDFEFETPADAQAFAALAQKVGFLGIGLGIHLVHIDDRAVPASWSYNV